MSITRARWRARLRNLLKLLKRQEADIFVLPSESKGRKLYVKAAKITRDLAPGDAQWLWHLYLNYSLDNKTLREAKRLAKVQKYQRKRRAEEAKKAEVAREKWLKEHPATEESEEAKQAREERKEKRAATPPPYAPRIYVFPRDRAIVTHGLVDADGVNQEGVRRDEARKKWEAEHPPPTADPSILD